MCGIIGYIGQKEANSIALAGLKSLEYRGYDSFGIANKTDKINVFKDVGKIGQIEKIPLENSKIAIGHSRWATHGGVTKANSHPHCTKDIAVVHNGIIENFQELKAFLISEGYNFKSETDTEIIAVHVQFFLDKGDKIEDAFHKTLQKLKGSFAIGLLYSEDNRIYFARRGSPLILGVGEEEMFLASDVPAFLEHTNKVIYLDDDEYGYFDENQYEIFTLDNQPVEKEIKIINWSVEQAKKGDYPHFMLKEINEQKQTVELAIEQDPEFLDNAAELIRQAKHVFFVGCGTSYHSCVSASYVFSKTAKKHVNVILGSEFRNYEHFLNENTLIIAVSQSGETADLLDAVKVAKKHSSKVIAIANVMGSTLTRMADHSIMMNAGPEICVLSTKSYTSQLAILTLLAYTTAKKFDEGKLMIQQAIAHIPKVIDENIEKLQELAEKIKSAEDLFLIGRDLAYPSALEGALKIKEVSYIHAEGFAGGELKHGTIALIEEDVPVLVFSTDDTRQLILSNAMEIKARGGYIIGIDSKENDIFDYLIKVPSVKDADPILMIIPIQILSYYLALKRGCDPDKPRNLAKSVTVK